MLTFWAFSFYYVGFHEILTYNISILLYVWTVCCQNICSRFYFLIYSIRLCFLNFVSKHPSHHVICLQRSQFSSLSIDMNTGFLYAYPSEFLWIVFANSYLSVLHSNNGCRSWIPSSQVLYVLIHFTISQIDLMDSSSEREDFHCFSFKVWRIFLTFIRSHTSDHEQK